MTEQNDLKGELAELQQILSKSLEDVSALEMVPCWNFLRTHGARLKRALDDAERYAWLRDQHQGKPTRNGAEWDEYTEPEPFAFTVFGPAMSGGGIEPIGCIAGELDAAIDTARASEQTP